MNAARAFVMYMIEILGNQGLALGFTFAVFILLRPVTNRLLRPKYRVALWMAGWVLGWGASFYGTLGHVQVLPVTFRGWITPRSAGLDLPGYIPIMTQAGEYTFALPGGGEIPFSVGEGMLNLAALLFLAGMLALVWWGCREENKLVKLSRQGEPMSEEWHRAHGIDLNEVRVRILPDLPASFVCRKGMVHYICLQKELPEKQMELVLRHELAHVKGHHVWAKGLVMALMLFYWWNPIIWAAYRLTSRDIELACDELVLRDLDEKQRRDYARTLVELASGQHLWGGLTCFGECDAEIRVRRTVSWKKEWLWTKVLVWPALAVAFLFFFTSPSDAREREAEMWAQFIQSSAPVETLRERLEDPTIQAEEVWVRDETLLVLTDDGEWWISRFSLSRGGVRAGSYYSNGWNRVESPGKYQFVQIK